MAKKPPRQDYEVGYGKPPRHAQFKKGQSGNPNGRPRQLTEDVMDIVQRVLLKPEPVMVNGKKQMLSGVELAILQVRNQAAKGDKRALATMVQLLKMLPPRNDNESDEPRVVQVRFKIGDEESSRRVAAAVEQERRDSLLSGGGSGE